MTMKVRIALTVTGAVIGGCLVGWLAAWQYAPILVGLLNAGVIGFLVYHATAPKALVS